MLGFKGERGYSAYEIAVQNGFIGSEKDWLAQLGVTNAYEHKSIVYQTSTENQSVVDLPSEYITNSMLSIYVDGLRLNETEYTIDTTTRKIILSKPVESIGTTIEVLITLMTTANLPIVTEITESSTNDVVPSGKCVYSIKSEMNKKIDKVKVPTGGLKDQILFKNTNADNDVGWGSLFDKVYPIGSIYMSVSNISPSTLFGGTWKQIEDRFLLATGKNYLVGEMGGEASHKLTEEEIPSHKHSYSSSDLNTTGKGWVFGNGGTVQLYSEGYKNSYTGALGGGKTHNNMPPYLVVNMWQRTA